LHYLVTAVQKIQIYVKFGGRDHLLNEKDIGGIILDNYDGAPAGIRCPVTPEQ
jgi:hypothetical protein